ncbi:ABC transporter ATP-binding protein [Rhizobium chutanense]|uniref:ABC transporter ATP-binding protein n=1 Tax=Rhizobium chutanense TaxID=2035448 RepID=A0A2A6JB92_9HYPH|nr:ATP-binding cassette domain-containing protein [Rhizobium chutanense]PDT03242.1 ABC transporter ATP-binding protein [Rhizobium chutanense]
MSTILNVMNLEKRFGSVSAAKNINVSVAEREIVAIIGTNGAGKTTFVNMVTGWLAPTSGDIRFLGTSIVGRRPREMTQLGLCRSFQVPQVFGSRSALENLVMAAAVAERSGLSLFSDPFTEERVTRCEMLLRDFRIGDYLHRKTAQLPQGIRKLLDIAMAMIAMPKMLLLDEPTSGVSIDEKLELMDIVMGALKAREVTVMFIEHDMEIVEKHAARVLAFFEGGIISDASPQQCFAHPTVQTHIVGEGKVSARLKKGGVQDA